MIITQKQIALHLGISRSLVSSALNDCPTVAKATRLRVVEAARELGYSHDTNSDARMLIGRRYGHRSRTSVVGALFSSSIDEHFVGSDIFRGLHQAARRSDRDVLVLARDPFAGFNLSDALVQERRCDGFVFVNYYTGLRPTLDMLAAHGVPAVTCLSTDNPEGTPWIVPDNRDAMRLAVEHLQARGHRRIGHLAGPPNHSDAAARLVGYTNAILRCGLESRDEWIVQGTWIPNPSDADVELILERDVTAVICGNDGQALQLWELAERRGLRIPDDLSIIGVDDIRESAARGLTSVSNPLARIGGEAVDALLGLERGEPWHSLCREVPVELVERNSVAHPRD